ncbi:peptidylprolyl isomerase [Flocculibacter collagenilyticus]|uniref:peptidylprolyl isomerase n=1 Tax=Flocculibacter collagenilyticus TaxID=2744479 RepID=UPI0018F6FB2B|nr:peptidylprolyl isomerase [Flocculibacter collagenilyticus]
MKHITTFTLFIIALFSLTISAAPKGEFVQPDNLFPQVKFSTSLGDFIVELDRTKAPITVNNFLSYVVNGEYNNTLFHRIEKNYVAQAGGYTDAFEEMTSYAPIFNESGSGYKNNYGTIAMARASSFNPHTATRQFFFNLKDNDNLNPGRDWGYAVFGYIAEGEDILEKLQEVEVGFHDKTGWPTVPKTPVIIKSITIVDEEK